MMRFAMLITLSLMMLPLLSLRARNAAQPPRDTAKLEARRFESVDWYAVRYVDFEPARREVARTLLYDRFLPAIGRDDPKRPRVMEFASGGSWDLMIVTPLPEGPGELEWELRPVMVAWMQRLAANVGGMATAQDMVDEFEGMIRTTEYGLLREHVGTEPASTRRSPVRVQR